MFSEYSYFIHVVIGDWWMAKENYVVAQIYLTGCLVILCSCVLPFTDCLLSNSANTGLHVPYAFMFILLV